MVSKRDNLLDWAFIASLVGGILIVAGGLLSGLMMLFMGTFMGHMAGAPSFFGGGWGGLWWGMSLGIIVWGLVTGTFVLLGAVKLKERPENPVPWALVVLIAGALSFPGSGGFGLGGLAAVAGGVLALAAGDASGARPGTSGEAG